MGPQLRAYLERLPDGLASYPGCLAKASLYRSIIEELPLDDTRLPEPLQDLLRRFLGTVPNLQTIGRNGMHRYNNQDHSMLTAKMAVDLIATGQISKDAIWAINVDDEYHEEKK